ncbi:SRPBCC domain-containing protein [Tateyamaria sp. SN3-11]|uniref:SRPBCC domain-containing protein n=1 Tax=Tateyamaria sp. SN3-11 TaxID=3092147 RepID=UPI0039EA30EC
MIADFGKLQFERKLTAPVDRVYQALISPQDRMAWGPPDTESIVLIEDQPTPTPGGRELSRCGPRDNPYVDVATDWIVMEASSRLVYAETLSAEGEVLGTSLATFELVSADTGTALRATVQIANFAGAEMMSEFEGGWTHAIENLATHVA